ncbi:hypothetical protein QYE76_059948 [Lolium multiflorum]|uniref:Protein kinase domain-containing protein n=1 Tax=Lolium multiflorum TaxID=4521 RepID=A0AAD8RZI1_LOLMU|nr:hypothetical protein QYE76_059948 [Lolium multiflorum]
MSSTAHVLKIQIRSLKLRRRRQSLVEQHVLWRTHLPHRTSHDVLERMLLDESADPTSLPLSFLQYITNHFSPDNQIGSGGFAVVYKGVVGKGIVAVKKLSNTSGLPEKKFHQELACLITAKHKNIVRFLGYCALIQGEMQKYEGKLVMADHRNWLLCFEYVCNGSLDKHITDATCGLTWRERYRIIRGVCEGLRFLREMRILHLDLKPANILLDGHMVPKIADFGLSRCLREDQTSDVTRNLSGTLGYVDPEFLRTGQMAFASDIYSLGVIIMEMLAGVRLYHEDKSVVESWMNRLGSSEGEMQLRQVRVCYKIGIKCMDLDPEKRPHVQHIIDMLDEASADYSDETGVGSSSVEPQAREQFEERIGKLAAQSFQKRDVKERSKILEDTRKHLGWLNFQESQEKVGQLSLWGVQDTKGLFNCHGAPNCSSIFTGFSENNILDIFNKRAHYNFCRERRMLEKSHFINTFTKEELRPILRSSNFIGKDAFAEVYEGVVDNARVAVKKIITGNEYGNKQFECEVVIQSQINHKNIVWLIGLCLEMDTPIFVYECLSRGSLNDILHSGSKVPLNLDVRLNIVAESAHGLAYLHSQTRNKIVHGDIKSKNILLDDNFIPKISVFGHSKLIGRTCRPFTFGDFHYMDPAYLQTGRITEKSDVYSFGVLILEIISRKKAARSDVECLVMSFLLADENWKTELFDKEIAVTGNLELLGYLAEIAVECVNLDVDQRPSMTDVAERLVILRQSRRLHTQHISGDYSDETAIRVSFFDQKRRQSLGVQDMNRPGASISSSLFAGINKLKILDIFNWKVHMSFDTNSSRILEESHFMKIFRKEDVMPILKIKNFIAKDVFYAVYRGVVGTELVTVKTPINDDMVENELFENEVIIQSQVVHKNILRLIGCCLEMDSPVLVYEYLSRGSLDDILHSGGKVPLDLDVRLTMVAESAQGLAYLHSQAHTKILHGDVNPASILLDDNFMPKISVTGSLMMWGDKTRTEWDTWAYMDPYMQVGLSTEKSDVYSFGVVILEVISRKKATYSDDDNLVNSFRDVHREGKKTTELFDKEIALAGNLEILDYLAEIAVQCLNFDVHQRPTMTYVAERLLTLQRYRRSQVVGE